MTWDEALAAMREGKTVSHTQMEGHLHIEFRPSGQYIMHTRRGFCVSPAVPKMEVVVFHTGNGDGWRRDRERDWMIVE